MASCDREAARHCLTLCSELVVLLDFARSVHGTLPEPGMAGSCCDSYFAIIFNAASICNRTEGVRMAWPSLHLNLVMAENHVLAQDVIQERNVESSYIWP